MNTGEIKKDGTLTISGLGLGRIKISDSETRKEMIFSGRTWVSATLEFKRLLLYRSN